ncbi:hypothetical protein B0J12DRAFT_735817 [Macrophomina phaseolina]|uniref:DUF6594 domain-containing protein n=1 Tax=Macrophomina phaseolina TaxID=35725 RepID=A0ABQ8GQH3_9PEZI|nr:hypothetical protein B0J12DRAFT_735817 [Macrophomina phaseolina]
MNEKSSQADAANRSFDQRRPSATHTSSSGDWCINITSRATTAVNSPIDEVEKYPCGYPRLAAFQSSDESFSIYRRFEYLHSRVLLGLQYELSELEQELQRIDGRDADDEKNARRLKSRKRDDIDGRKESKRNEGARTRSVIVDDIRRKLVEYDELLIKTRETGAFQRPSNRDYTSVITWFNNWKPLVKKEWYSLQQWQDMLTLRQGREWAGFDGFVEKMLSKCDCAPVRWIFQPRNLLDKTEDKKHLHYYDSKRVESFVALIITVIIFILLVLPVVVMYQLTSIGTRSSTFTAIGVLVVFTLLFSAAMSSLTKAKRHELFAASAAYCAVLVVFISNFNGPNDGSATR